MNTDEGCEGSSVDVVLCKDDHVSEILSPTSLVVWSGESLDVRGTCRRG